MRDLTFLRRGDIVVHKVAEQYHDSRFEGYVYAHCDMIGLNKRIPCQVSPVFIPKQAKLDRGYVTCLECLGLP